MYIYWDFSKEKSHLLVSLYMSASGYAYAYILLGNMHMY